MSTPIPKPTPPKRPVAEKTEQPTSEVVEAPVVKKPFIPKPHLTSNPFRNSEELRELQKSLNKTKSPMKRRPTQNKKVQEKK